MKLKWVKKRNGKWVRRWTLEESELVTLIVLVLALNYFMIRLIVGKV